MTSAATIADGLKNAINAEFSGQFVARRTWDVNAKVSSLSAIDVLVYVGPTQTRTVATRKSSFVDHTVEVVVRQRIDGSNAATSEIDAIHAKAEAIGAALQNINIGVAGVHWLSVETTTVIDYESLKDTNVFLSTHIVTFREQQTW